LPSRDQRERSLGSGSMLFEQGADFPEALIARDLQQ
jgi:hypothetical protein